MSDPINSPSHYVGYGIEVIEITSYLPGDLSNALKYILRAGLKDGEPFAKDIAKALVYLRDFGKRLRDMHGYPMPYLRRPFQDLGTICTFISQSAADDPEVRDREYARHQAAQLVREMMSDLEHGVSLGTQLETLEELIISVERLAKC